MKCPICETSTPLKYFEKLEIDCAFLEIEKVEQHLIRYRCPICDVIFGSLQMINLPVEELKAAYQAVFDAGYRDGNENSANVEVFDLLAMNPSYDGYYLNYGAGTSSASEKAAKLGYRLLPYDPFVLDQTGYETELKLYDGLISHNLVEHLQDPVEEFKKMKKLLKPGAVMIHSTECFKYIHAHTKFHLFFLEGKSLGIVAEKSGFKHEFIGPWTVKFTQL